MSIETLVTEALHDAADSRPVDVTALHARTRAAIAERGGAAAPAASSRRRTWVMASAAAGIVVAVGAGAALTGLLGQGPLGSDRVRDGAPAGGVEVATEFTCPAQGTTRFPSEDDDSFLPELTRGLQPAGEAKAAPLSAVEQTDDGAVLRLANADGSLASVVTFRRSGQGYERVAVTKCVNDASYADGGAPPLVTEGLPASPDALTADDLAPGAVKVVDRMTYDTVGLAKRHGAWAEPCERRLCLVAGTRTGTITTGPLPREPVPEDRTSQLTDPDDVVGQDVGLRLVAVYDSDDELSEVSWSDSAGRATSVEPVTAPGWSGQLFLILAPAQELDAVTVQPSDGGAATTYPAAEIRD
jgi:hypothetical protein